MIQAKDFVRITCESGYETEYPAFYKAFHNVKGQVVSDVVDSKGVPVEFLTEPDVTRPCAALLRIDITKKGEPNKSIITVPRRWLTKLPKEEV